MTDSAGTAMAARPRIALMIENDPMGGAQLMMLRLASGLHELGYEVVYFGPAAGTGWLAGEFSRLGVETVPVALRGPIDFSCLSRLRRDLVRLRINLVHSHEFAFSLYGSLACRSLGLPHISTLHGSYQVLEAARRRQALRLAFFLSDTAVAVSHFTERHLRTTLGGRLSNLVVIPNGVPLLCGDREAARRSLNVGTDEKLLLALGTHKLVKGHRYLIEAVRRLPATEKYRLVIAGGEDEATTALEAQIRAAGLDDSVQLLGKRSDIGDLLAAADVFVMPSLHEGLPLALLEAMRMGKPVVASRVGGMPEVIEHEVNGLLVPPADEDALATALQRAATSPAARVMAQRGKHLADTQYSAESMVNRYHAVYEKALTRRMR